MMKTKFFWILGLIAVAILTLQAEETTQSKMDATNNSAKIEKEHAQGYKVIHTKELKELIKSNPDVILVDARSAEYDDGTRIFHAKFLPYDTNEVVISHALPDKNATIVVYCTSIQCPVSKYLAERLVKMGYAHVWKYPDGLQEWQSHNHPVDKVKPGKISGMNGSK